MGVMATAKQAEVPTATMSRDVRCFPARHPARSGTPTVVVSAGKTTAPHPVFGEPLQHSRPARPKNLVRARRGVAARDRVGLGGWEHIARHELCEVANRRECDQHRNERASCVTREPSRAHQKCTPASTAQTRVAVGESFTITKVKCSDEVSRERIVSDRMLVRRAGVHDDFVRAVRTLVRRHDGQERT